MYDVVIEATYDGAHGSLGYRKGERYLLVIRGNSIRRVDGNGNCPYTSLEVFFQIWKDIKVRERTFTNSTVADL